MTAEISPRYVQIADQLHARAKSRDVGSPLSVRKVASEFGVSSVTATRALQLFRVRLVDQAVSVREAQDNSAAKLERWAVCLHVSPGPHQHAAAQLTADGFRSLTAEGGLSFDFDSLRPGEQPDAKRIKAGIATTVASGAKGIFFLPSRVSHDSMLADELLLQSAAAAGLPVVLLERNLRGNDRPLARDLVSFHDFEGGRLLTRHLQEQGRRRIAFLTGSPTSSHLERLAGYLSALHSSGAQEPLVVEQSATGNPGAVYTELANRLIEWQADGVICYHEYAAVGIIMELLRRGRAVPADTAVAAFYNLGLGESYSIGITAYSYPAKTVAARALDIMRWRLKAPDAPPLKVVVPGELIVRNSSCSSPVAER
ncbi:HTH-type transcriptional regulator DegA [Anatilimnocola aggregata]|uniref:HTH-type transcriptional regulator DegA n=1 Tax=Anatilimnocola aggregata TaxID=2528021 RepID=A0A517YHP6_9BACT|nr:substrate-binding domain-containing protein [Anatilimnocola aggregata]QDU29760.1 HTH-type transcriptional regulator DegA [Anatilimnocola aggregata]